MTMTKKNLVLLFCTFALLAGGLAAFVLLKKDDERSYAEFSPRRGELLSTVEATGLVSPQNRLEIKPPVAGRIEEVLVKEGEMVKKSTILAWISSNERAALLDSVRAQGQKEIKKWEDLYRPTPVIAPINGTIILRNVEAGQSFTNTDPIFVMADRLTVKAQVDETDIAQIKKGQGAMIVLDAYPKSPIRGQVVHVAFDATLTNNVTTYLVDVLPDEVPEFMRSGMTSNVSIHVDKRENVLLIPVFALVTSESGPQVLVKGSKGPNLVPVETGLDNGKLVEIKQGLLESDVVLVPTGGPGKKKKSSNPLFPTGGRRGGGRR